jgi:hypothetical protein
VYGAIIEAPPYLADEIMTDLCQFLLEYFRFFLKMLGPDAASGGVQHLHGGPGDYDPQRSSIPHPASMACPAFPSAGSTVAAPFHADAREHLITVRATNYSAGRGEFAQHVVHFTAQKRHTLLHGFSILQCAQLQGLEATGSGILRAFGIPSDYRYQVPNSLVQCA